MLDDLPRAEQTARSVAEQLRSVGSESAARTGEFDLRVGQLTERATGADRIIGESKRQTGKAILDPRREQAVRRTYVEALPGAPRLAEKLVDLLIEAAKAQQSIDD